MVIPIIPETTFLGAETYNVPNSKNGWKKYERMGIIKIRWVKEEGVGKVVCLR